MPIIPCSQCGAKNRVDDRAVTMRPVCGRCGAGLPRSASDGKPLEVTDASFTRDVLSVRGRPVLVDCWAPWCGPCRALAPVLDQLAARAAGRYIVGKLNVDENPRVAQQFEVRSIPTLLVFKDGQLADRLVGIQSAQAIEGRLLALA